MDRVVAALERVRAQGPPRLEALTEVGDPRSVGLVPGSFDPLTVAHVALADSLGTDVRLFLYSPATLPKEAGPSGEVVPPLLSEEDRIASLLSFAGEHDKFGVAICSHGLYVDQAEAAAAAFPGVPLTFGVGSDKVVQLFDPAWYEDRDAALQRLFAVARVAYAVRRGDERRVAETVAGAGRWARALRRVDLGELVDVSSRSVRHAFRRGEDPSPWVPSEVVAFLRRFGTSS